MWDKSIFSSIKPKHDKWLFVYFYVFPRIYLSCTENCSEHQNKTIFGATQVNLGENTKVNKQSLVIFWLNWRKYGAVSYSFSCKKILNSFITFASPWNQTLMKLKTTFWHLFSNRKYFTFLHTVSECLFLLLKFRFSYLHIVDTQNVNARSRWRVKIFLT